MKTVAIIQARMGSSRLPGKMLMPLAGLPVIQHVYDRTRRIAGLDEVLVATTVAPADDPLAIYCETHGIPLFRGSEDDVLGRYCRAAQKMNADAVVRITGDCPLLDPIESAKVLVLFRETPGCDYASNTNPPFLPDGLDTEVVRAATLEQVCREVQDPVAHEHVTYYVAQHPEKFRAAAVKGSDNLQHLRWTLDNREDFELLSALTDEVKKRRQFGYLHEVLAILHERRGLATINQNLQRNEGLERSLEQQRRLLS